MFFTLLYFRKLRRKRTVLTAVTRCLQWLRDRVGERLTWVLTWTLSDFSTRHCVVGFPRGVGSLGDLWLGGTASTGAAQDHDQQDDRDDQQHCPCHTHSNHHCQVVVAVWRHCWRNRWRHRRRPALSVTCQPAARILTGKVKVKVRLFI